jgi:uncharacterized membrane protein YfcA
MESRQARRGRARLEVLKWTLGLSLLFGAIGATLGSIAGLDHRSAELYWQAGVVAALAAIPGTRAAKWYPRVHLRRSAQQAFASAVGFVLALAVIERL